MKLNCRRWYKKFPLLITGILSGRKIKTVVDENLEEGDHILQLNREHLDAGIYFLRVKINSETSIMKVVIQ